MSDFASGVEQTNVTVVRSPFILSMSSKIVRRELTILRCFSPHKTTILSWFGFTHPGSSASKRDFNAARCDMFHLP